MYKGMIEVPWTGQPSGQIPRIKSKYKKPLVITDFGNGRHNLVSGDQGFDVVNAFRSLRLGTAGMNVYLGAGVDAFAIKLPPNSLVTTDTPFWMFVYLAKRNSYTNRYHVSIGSPSGTHYAAIGNFPGNLTGAAESETLRVWSTNILVPSRYPHAFILEYTGAALNLYEDGIFVGSYATSTLIDNARTHFYLGGNTVTINSSVSEKYFGGVFEGSMPSSFPSEFQADPYNTVLEPMLVPMSIPRRPAKRKLWNMSIPFRSDTDTPVSLEPNPASAEGVCFLWSGKFHRNELITGKRSVNGVATQTVDAQGLVAQCYDNNQNIEWPGQFITTSNDTGTGDFSMMIVANPSIGPGVEYLLSQKNDPDGYPYAQCILLANSDVNGNYSAGSACFYTYSGSQVSCAAISQVDGEYHVWAGVRVGTTLQLWRDGVLVASSSGVAQGLVQAGRSMNIGSQGNNTSESFRGRALAAAAWNRALSPEEIGKYRSPQEAQALLFKPIDIPVNAGTLVTTRREVGHMELPWGGQPNEPCEIDRANPLTNGLVTAWHAGDLTGVAGGGVYTLSGTASRGLSRLGLEVTSKMNGYANNGIVVSGATPVRTSRATVLMFTSGIGASNYERGNLAYSYDWSFQFDPTTRKMRFGYQGDGYYDTGAAIPLNAPCMVGASIVSSGNTVYYLNGVVNSTAGPDAGYEYESAIAGAGGASGYGSTNAGLLAIFVFNRILSPAEVNALYLEPWQVFKPKTLTSDQPALIRQLEPLTPTDGYTPRILLEQ